MSQNVKGTFAGTYESDLVASGLLSDVLLIPSGVVTARLTAPNLDANNTIQTRKSVDNGQTWANQVTYNSAQANTAITVVAGEQWQMVGVVQAGKNSDYSLSVES